MPIFCQSHAYGDILPALGLRYGRGFLFSQRFREDSDLHLTEDHQIEDFGGGLRPDGATQEGFLLD